MITSALEQNDFNLTRAAERLKLTRHSLRYRMQRLNMNPGDGATNELPVASEQKIPKPDCLMNYHLSRYFRSAWSRLPLHRFSRPCRRMLSGALSALIWRCRFRKTEATRKHRQRRHERPAQSHARRKPAACRPVREEKSPTANANVLTVMQHSRAITRKSASNLALAFVLLPRAKRDAMSALYAFCREVDDVADEESVAGRKTPRHNWPPGAPTCAAPAKTNRRNFPSTANSSRSSSNSTCRSRCSTNCIKGCEMDLEIKRYENFEQLELYCYRVASVVGLLSIEIFGYQNPAMPRLRRLSRQGAAIDEILRDVKTDAARGRIYLPLDELKKFGVIARGNFAMHEYSDRYCATRRERRRAGKRILPACATNPARRRPQCDGRRRIDGLGLLAAAAKTGTAAISMSLAREPARLNKASKGLADFSFLAALRLRRGDLKLRRAVRHLHRSSGHAAGCFNSEPRTPNSDHRPPADRQRGRFRPLAFRQRSRHPRASRRHLDHRQPDGE